MFIIMAASPIYDNRDGICGARVRQAVPYAFETEALAHRKVPSDYDEDGQHMECTHFVASTSDPWRRPVPRPCPPVDPFMDDIPF